MLALTLLGALWALLAATWGDGVTAGTAEAAGTVELQAGLNLRAYTGPTAPVERALGAALPAVRAIWWWQAALGEWAVWGPALPPGRGGLRVLARGEQYWLLSSQTVAWRYPGAAGVRTLAFQDVTTEAGVSYRQHALSEGGECVLSGEAFDAGTACTPERISGGAAVTDVDGDGWPDLFVTRLDAPDILFGNQGDGTFRDVTEASGWGRWTRIAMGPGGATSTTTEIPTCS